MKRKENTRPTTVPFMLSDVELLESERRFAVRVRHDARNTAAWSDDNVKQVRRAIKTRLRIYAGLTPRCDYAIPVQDVLRELHRRYRAGVLVTAPHIVLANALNAENGAALELLQQRHVIEKQRAS